MTAVQSCLALALLSLAPLRRTSHNFALAASSGIARSSQADLRRAPRRPELLGAILTGSALAARALGVALPAADGTLRERSTGGGAHVARVGSAAAAAGRGTRVRRARRPEALRLRAGRNGRVPGRASGSRCRRSRRRCSSPSSSSAALALILGAWTTDRRRRARRRHARGHPDRPPARRLLRPGRGGVRADPVRRVPGAGRARRGPLLGRRARGEADRSAAVRPPARRSEPPASPRSRLSARAPCRFPGLLDPRFDRVLSPPA